MKEIHGISMLVHDDWVREGTSDWESTVLNINYAVLSSANINHKILMLWKVEVKHHLWTGSIGGSHSVDVF